MLSPDVRPSTVAGGEDAEFALDEVVELEVEGIGVLRNAVAPPRGG